MSNYSVADAKNGLPRLIDNALQGEEVVITRHGRPVVELRPIAPAAGKAQAATYDWLKARRARRKGVGMTSVQLLDKLYDEPEG